jgi:hypothetical protein
MSINRRHASTALLGSALAAALPAWAQSPAFPNKPIRIIVPYPAGGATDVSARLVGQRLQEELKQAVVVDNRPGASGNIGMQALLQSPADGYTIAMSLTGMLSINPATYAKAGFSATDVVPIARVMLAPLVLVVPLNSPWRSIQDLVAAGKAAGKGGLPYGSTGAGGIWPPSWSTQRPMATTATCLTGAARPWSKPCWPAKCAGVCWARPMHVRKFRAASSRPWVSCAPPAPSCGPICPP